MNDSKISRGILKANGFGLMEALVAAAILGVVATGIISQQKLSVKSSFTIAADAEMNNITKRLLIEIGDEATCSANFAGKIPGDSVPVPPGEQYGNLVSTSGANIIEVDKTYGISETLGTSLKTSLGEILVTDIRTFRKSATSNEMILRIYFKRKDKTAVLGVSFAQATVYRDIPLNILMSPAPTPNVIKSCFGDYAMMASTAVELSCKGNVDSVVTPPNPGIASARYETSSLEFPYGRCVHSNIDTPCPDGQLLKSAGLNNQNEAVYTCGGIDQMCPAGKIITGFNPDGTVACGEAYKPCLNGGVIIKNSAGVLVCSTGDCTAATPLSAFGGFDANGATICNPIASLKNCGTDNFATQITPGGTLVCNQAAVSTGSCPPGKRVTGIDSNGAVTCGAFINIPYSCGVNRAIKGINADGSFDCQPIERPLACGIGAKNHSYNECKAASGWIVNADNGNSHCAFNQGSCPGGWTPCQQYGAQATVGCMDTSNTYYCDGYRQPRYAFAPAGGTYHNGGSNSVSCIYWYGQPNTSRACFAAYQAPVYTYKTQIGCY